MLLMIHGYRITPHGELRRTGYLQDRMILFHHLTSKEILDFSYVMVIDVLSDRSSYVRQKHMKELFDWGVEL